MSRLKQFNVQLTLRLAGLFVSLLFLAFGIAFDVQALLLEDEANRYISAMQTNYDGLLAQQTGTIRMLLNESQSSALVAADASPDR